MGGPAAEAELQRQRGELERERRNREQAQQALERERSAREQAEQRLRGVQEALDRERSAREQAERRSEQAEQQLRGVQEELGRERSTREQTERRLRGVQEELERERSTREQAERRLQEEGRPSASSGQGGLVSAGISTASRSEIEAATEQLARGRILGRGGFGPVYSGVWRGRECAIKVLDAASMQGTKEFLKEVNMLGIFRHPHLVPLLAFCISSEDIGRFFALIYPLMSSSVEDALRPQRGADHALLWSVRLSIALDAAAGLAFLHSSEDKPVILHRDIKTANILLDTENRARISDVGLARPMDARTSQTLGVGSFGYMDHAYLTTGEFEAGSDVFSFGVVLLELLTGEAACDSTKRPPILHARVGVRLPRDAAVVADPRARWLAPVAEQFASLAKDCISVEVAARPTSQAIVERLSLLGQEPERAEEQVMARECILCMSHSRRTRLRPCCHVVYCEECAEEAARRRMPCPMCRGPVQRYDVGDFNATHVPA